MGATINVLRAQAGHLLQIWCASVRPKKNTRA